MSSPSITTPFFDPELLLALDKYPPSSQEWKSSIDQISNKIKQAEEFLRTQFADISAFEVQVENAVFTLSTHGGSQLPRLCYKNPDMPNPRPVIELPLNERKEAYRNFKDLFDYLPNSSFAQEADSKAKNISTKSTFEIIKEVFENVKIGIFSSPKLERLIEELVRLRKEVPKDETDIKSKAQWFKNLANLLVDSDIFKQVFEQVKLQIPQIWSQLSFKQKLKFGALAPIVGAGAYIGGIGLAGGGSAVGIPVVLVILLLLLLNNSLIDFLDYIIKQLSIVVRTEPSHDAVSKLFETILETGIKSVFGKNHDISNSERVENDICNEGIDPRSFEFLAVTELAKRYNGIGHVTRYSSDGGIDGYIVCDSQKEVLLVQAKLYKNKVGFPEVTQYLGTFFYWKKTLEAQFPYPISRMILACPTDYSIEAKKVADAFSDLITLEKVLIS